jgi:hypothetical protein
MKQRNCRFQMLRRFFSGLTESVFLGRLGVADPPLVDYLSELLVRFIRNDAIFGIRDPTGKRLVQVADMLAEANARQGEARRTIHRQIGDCALFWTGVYPEMIARLPRSGQKDGLLDYRTHGKRAYYIASTIPAEQAAAPAEVLERLSHDFELCAFGLSEIRREWEHRDGGDSLALLLIG